jgi:hypothetical protein
MASNIFSFLSMNLLLINSSTLFGFQTSWFSKDYLAAYHLLETLCWTAFSCCVLSG